jgi:ribonuclease HI
MSSSRGKIVDPRSTITIFTDGSANGQGGAGYVFLMYKDKQFVGYGAAGEGQDYKTTNNQAELRAIHMAMLHLLKSNEPRKITFYSDSQYSIGVLFNRNWKVKANQELIYDMRDYIDELRRRGCEVNGEHVPREEKHISMCDKWANHFRHQGEVVPYVKQKRTLPPLR